MLIGLTYDLRKDYLAEGYSELETAEFDSEQTIDSLAQTIEELGHQVERIGNARQLIKKLAAGDRWDLVFNIAEGLSGFGREAQIPCILDVYRIPYTFSDPLVLCLSLNKAITKIVVRDAGLATAEFLTVTQLSDLDRFSIDWPVIVKPIAEGTGKGIDGDSIFYDFDRLKVKCAELLDLFKQPVLVEKFLSGREYTVGILGGGEEAVAIGTLEVKLLAGAERQVYSYVNKEQCESLVEYVQVTAVDDEKVKAAELLAIDSWRLLGATDAGRVDIREDEFGVPHFLEVNPLSGLHPTHSDLPILCTRAGISYRTLIEKIIDSSARRAGLLS